MTIQVFIEGEDHADIVRQLKGLAEAFGVSSAPVVHTTTWEISGPGVSVEKKPPEDPPSRKEAPESDPKTPNPTKKTVALAEELGVDLDQVQGSGKDGRVTQVDVKEYAKQRTPASEETSEGESTDPEPPDEEPATVPAADPFGDGETIEPTKDNATAALRVVHGEKGMDACMKVLSRFDAKRIGDVPEEHYPAFMVACAETLDVDTAGLKQQIDGLAA